MERGTHRKARARYVRPLLPSVDREGLRITTDNIVQPIREYSIRNTEPTSEYYWIGELQQWDRVCFHKYEYCEGVTSGEVYKFVDGGVVIGEVVRTW